MDKDNIIDYSIYSNFEDLLGSKLITCLRDYILCSDDYFVQMENNLESKKFNKLLDYTHPLKSSSLQIGLRKLSEETIIFEALVNAQNEDETIQGFKKLKALYLSSKEKLFEIIQEKKNCKRALIFDDDIFFLSYARQILVDLGFDVVETSSTEDANEFIKSHYVDFLLVDWNMPTISGPEFIRHVRQSANDIPVILYTNKEHEEGIKESQSCGADGFIGKPIDKFKLKKILTNMNLLKTRKAA